MLQIETHTGKDRSERKTKAEDRWTRGTQDNSPPSLNSVSLPLRRPWATTPIFHFSPDLPHPVSLPLCCPQPQTSPKIPVSYSHQTCSQQILWIQKAPWDCPLGMVIHSPQATAGCKTAREASRNKHGDNHLREVLVRRRFVLTWNQPRSEFPLGHSGLRTWHCCSWGIDQTLTWELPYAVGMAETEKKKKINPDQLWRRKLQLHKFWNKTPSSKSRGLKAMWIQD